MRVRPDVVQPSRPSADYSKVRVETGQAHFATPTLMEELLAKEKIKVEEDTIIDFEKLFWDPAKELEIN